MSIENEQEIIKIPDSLQNKLEIETVKLMPVRYELKVKTVYNPEKIVRIYAPVNGTIQIIIIAPGYFVKQGDTLAIMHTSSTSTIKIQKELLNAQSAYSIAEQNLHTVREMCKSGLYSQKKFQAAILEQKRADNELKRLKSKLLKIKSDQELKEKHYVTTPIAGYIVESKLKAGLVINNPAHQSIFSIANIEDLSLETWPDKKSTKTLTDGKIINFSSPSWPGSICQGKITSEKIIGKHESKLNIKFQNPALCLGLSLPPEFVLNYSDNNRKELAVPATAVLTDIEKSFVIVFTADKKFIKRAICITEKANNIYYVDCGLNEGEKIITNSHLAMQLSKR